jgi:membrane protease YdiL (CAAX protease family)
MAVVVRPATSGSSRASSWAFARRRPVLTYFALTFALSWGVGLLRTGGLGPLFGPDWRSDLRFTLALLAGPVAAAIAGLALTGLVAGRAGYRELRTRLLRWQVGARWYALALLLAPLTTLTAAVLLARAFGSPAFLPEIFAAQDPAGLLLPGVVAGLWVGFFEELGWTGFAVPRLRRRYGVLTTGLLVGVVWGAWHFPLFRESGSFTGALPLALLLAKLCSWLPAYRVLMVWAYDRTGSLLLAVLMHASLTATTMSLASGGLSVAQSVSSVLVWAGVLWAAVAAVAVANGGRIGPRPTPTPVAGGSSGRSLSGGSA